jgi:hypothetical protein
MMPLVALVALVAGCAVDRLSLVKHATRSQFGPASSKDDGEYPGSCPFCDGSDRFMVWSRSMPDTSTLETD